MSDVFSTVKRRAIMGRIRSTNTHPERALRSFLRKHKIRFRQHVRSLPGKPDFVIPHSRAVIFVNGCFWHHHPRCKRATFPSTRIHFWRKKILGNASRDRRNNVALRKLGWRAITVWQCQLAPKKAAKQLSSLLTLVRTRPNKNS
jgi:DNA mismatch endonuclease (patch repair protein)